MAIRAPDGANNRALMPNNFKTCHTEQASRRALESSSFFEMHDTYSFSQSSFIGSEEQQECNIVLRREESTSKGLAFVATSPGTADDEDFVSYSSPVLFDMSGIMQDSTKKRQEEAKNKS